MCLLLLVDRLLDRDLRRRNVSLLVAAAEGIAQTRARLMAVEALVVARAAAGINEGLLRIAVGLEAVEDLQADLERGLSLI